VLREGWDLRHGWDSRPVVILPALAARSRSGAPLVIDWADWWGRGGTQAEREGGLAKRLYAPIETYFEEAFRTRADGTTVISEALAGRARALGVAAGTIHRLPQGCDPSAAMVTDRAAARARLGVPLSEPMFVSVGRLLPADGQLLFEAMDYVLRERPDARLVLIGRHGAKIPGALVRSGRVVESGFVTDELLRQNMSACDALVVALADTIASWARWPSKVNPFLASGRAVVVTRVGDLPALLEREGAAFVAAPEPRALAEATIAAASERDRRSNHEQRALELARGRLAWPVIIDDLLAFYRRVPQGPAVCPTVSESSNA
jgi:glycosyltransferase involved in cell wall biosynthesis